MKIGIVVGDSALKSAEWQWYLECMISAIHKVMEIEILTICSPSLNIRSPILKESKLTHLRFPVSYNKTKGLKYLEEWQSSYQKNYQEVPTSSDLIDYIRQDTFQKVIFLGSSFENLANGIIECPKKSYVIPTCNLQLSFDFMTMYAPLIPRISGLISTTESRNTALLSHYPWPVPLYTWEGCPLLEDPDLTIVSESSPELLFTGFKSSPNAFSAAQAIQSLKDELGINTSIADLDQPNESSTKRINRNTRALVVDDGSLSTMRSLFLAWEHKVPILLNSECQTLLPSITASSGGLYYRSFSMLRSLLAWMVSHYDESRTLGTQGWRYLKSQYDRKEMSSKLQNILCKEVN